VYLPIIERCPGGGGGGRGSGGGGSGGGGGDGDGDGDSDGGQEITFPILPPNGDEWYVICHKQEKKVYILLGANIDKKKHRILAGPFISSGDAKKWADTHYPTRKC
jgi:hypothetical protein